MTTGSRSNITSRHAKIMMSVIANEDLRSLMLVQQYLSIHLNQWVFVANSSWKGNFKVLKSFADYPNVYLVCQGEDHEEKLRHKDILQFSACRRKNGDDHELTVSGMFAVGASDPDFEKLKTCLPGVSIVNNVINMDAEG